MKLLYSSSQFSTRHKSVIFHTASPFCFPQLPACFSWLLIHMTEEWSLTRNLPNRFFLSHLITDFFVELMTSCCLIFLLIRHSKMSSFQPIFQFFTLLFTILFSRQEQHVSKQSGFRSCLAALHARRMNCGLIYICSKYPTKIQKRWWRKMLQPWWWFAQVK